MKLRTKNFPLVLLVTIGLYGIGCSEKNTALDPVEKVQLAKLSNTWTVSSVTLDNISKIADFADFKLTLAGTFHESTPRGPYQYAVAGKRPSNNPWPPAGGTWSFGADPSKDLARHDNPDLTINYTVADRQLIIRFSYVGDGFTGGRASQVSGNWVFTFIK